MKSVSSNEMPVFKLNDPKVGEKIDTWMLLNNRKDCFDEKDGEKSNMIFDARVGEQRTELRAKDVLCRLEYNLKNKSNNSLGLIDSINEAISPLRALDDLLCVGSFCEGGLVVEACARIISASIRDLEYVLEKWSAL